MKNKIYKIGQKIESTSKSCDYITSAEFEVCITKRYGFISEIYEYTYSNELPDGTTESITEISYYAVSLRNEIDRYTTFYDGYNPRKNFHKIETINFPLNRIYIGVDDPSEEYNFTPVKEFNFTHDLSLLS